MNERKSVLIISSSENNTKYFTSMIEKHLSAAQVYSSKDVADALFKIDNVPPQVVIIDSELSKGDILEGAEKVLAQKNAKNVALVLVSSIPDKEHFVDEVVLGKVQFLTEPESEKHFIAAFYRALNFASRSDQNTTYSVRYLPEGAQLFSEGDEADCAFVLRKGEMKAVKNSEEGTVAIGIIAEGEFVGEMAHITGGKRTASVIAVADCELIELPYATLDSVLFSKPAWAKALVLTLSKRLKRTSQALVE